MGQAMQVVGQAAQSVTAQVEDLQRVGQLKNLGGELGQPARQIKAFEARQLAGAQFGEGIHKQGRVLVGGAKSVAHDNDLSARGRVFARVCL